ncbi:MAG: PEP-CTERM sorting domain-containing protein [Rhizobacter sp.]|nr:PEP-CTERM sorting domain-containing protein [Rhizobacter sp.]
MKRTLLPVFLGTGLLLACAAGAQTINFDDLAAGTTLGNQYASLGVTFAANAFSGPGSSSSGMPWATNTDMTIVSIDTGTLGIDYGALGTPSLVSKNILQNFLNWETVEDGDPSFNINLAKPATSVSVTFAGVGGQSAAPDTRIFAYAGSTLLGTRAGSLPDDNVGQLTLSFSGSGITRVAVAPGSFDDWVGVDNIVITPTAAVPEPEILPLTLLGLATIVWTRRRRQF